MNAKVSIILISYNVIKYMRECMESVVNQTLREVEIICVDAFSNDGTREIIKEYMEKDSRIMLLDDVKKSCGFSYNLGIAKASGEYVGFVETDDYVRLDMFERLYYFAKNGELDFVKGNHQLFVNIDEDIRFFEEHRIFEGRREMYNRIINPFLYPEIIGPDHCMWNGIYKREFLLDKGIKLNETAGPAYQDHGFQWQTICEAERVMYLDEAFYYYRKDNESSSMKRASGLVKDYAEYMFIKEYLQKKENVTREHWWSYFGKMVWSVHTWCSNILLAGDEFPKEAYDILDSYRDEFIIGIREGWISPSKLYFELYAESCLLAESRDTYLTYLKNKAKSIEDYKNATIEKAGNIDKVIIVGCGTCGKRLYTLLKRAGIDTVIAFGDNNVKLWGTSTLGIGIESIDYLCKQYKNALFIIANNEQYMDLMRQLRGNGIDEKSIAYYRTIKAEF